MTKTDIEQQIAVETRACVEQAVKDKKFLGFLQLTPRKKVEPGCELKIREKYAPQLAALGETEQWNKQAVDDALNNQLSGNNVRLYGIIGAVFVFMLIIIIITS